MENVNKALMFGVGIFITLLLVSGVITIFSQMKEIYTQVSSTDTSLSSMFSEYAMYENTTVTGLDVVNCANKYYNKSLIVVSYNGIDVNTEDGVAYLDSQVENGTLSYVDKYLATVEDAEYDGVIKTKITFTKM